MASKSYVSHDSNARNSKKMVRMRSRLGEGDGLVALAAYGVYWMLIERLREEEDYTCDLDYEMLAFDLRADADLIRRVVEDFDLFEISEDGKTFRSHGLEERMALMEQKSSAGKKGAAARWGNRENTDRMAQNGENMAVAFSANAKINKNKIKENKENYSSSLSSSLKESEEEESEEKQQEEILSYFFFFLNSFIPLVLPPSQSTSTPAKKPFLSSATVASAAKSKYS